MQTPDRLHALDAVRAFALLLGIFFHAAISFIPELDEWAITDKSTSIPLSIFVGLSHIFRMSLFFFIAGFFAHLVYHRKGASTFARDRAKRILLPFVVGWAIMMPLIGMIWRWGHAKSGVPLKPWPDIPGEIPLTHLWFLYFLILFYIALVGFRYVLVDRLDKSGHLRNRIDRALTSLVARNWAPVIASIPLALAAVFVPEWSAAAGMPTPDHSVFPQLLPFAGYGAAFVLGWLFHRNVGLLQMLTDRVKLSLWLCLATWPLVGAASAALYFAPTFAPALLQFLAALAATAMMWYFNFALIGFALKKFSNPSPRTRYVADASYWLYLAHLPIVCVLQVWIAHWPLHWIVKYPLIVGITFAILFVSYHYLVRSTAIGEVLNGRKYPRTSLFSPNADGAAAAK